MKIAIDRSAECLQVDPADRSPRHRRHIIRILLAISCLLAATAAQAQEAEEFDAALGYDSETPWMSEVLAAIDAYVPDPAFNGGRLGLDHFADSNSLDQVGAVTAKLANGDMVVAGLVPDGVSGGFCGDGTKLCSIGLVRYKADGHRRTWTNPGSSGRYSNQYVVYPGASSSFRYQYLRDVKVHGNYIDVMVDHPDAGHPALTLGHRNVSIVTFGDDGSYLSDWQAFGRGYQPEDNEDFYGAQMVQMNSTTIIVVATAYDSVGPYIAVSSANIFGNGGLYGIGSWGSPYGTPPNTIPLSFLTRYYGPSQYCSAPVNGRCEVTASYVVKPDGNPFADFYIAGNQHYAGNDWDVITLKISSQNGALKSEYGGGWVRTSFDQANSTNKDLSAGLYVYNDEVYLAAQVARKCHGGIGMAKINGSTGGLISAFGTGGKIVFGGQGDAPFCYSNGGADVPTAISATGGRIGIAGYSRYRDNNFFYVDPMLAVVNAVNGSLFSFDSYPVKRADGSRYGDGALYGIYGGPNPTSPFTVSGNGRDASTGNTLSYLAGRLIPVSADRIFASGFGTGADY